MTDVLHLLTLAMLVPVLIGLITTLLGVTAVTRFARKAHLRLDDPPPVTVMKPLCGDEPLLDEALASICRQTYPNYQIIFGVQNANDPALRAVDHLREAFPDREIDVVVSSVAHGPNNKIGNLINMLPAARHEVLVFSDSDMHVQPDYLENVVATLMQPGTGMVTALSTGMPTVSGLAARLGATQITHSYLPGVLMGRALGRQDCLGTTMALRRQTLERIGGLRIVVGYLAEDNVLGQLVRGLGLAVALADVVPATAVAERSLSVLWQHEFRWTRTIRGLEPGFLAASVVQFPLFWAALACLLSGAAAWTLAVFVVAWVVRAVANRWIDHVLDLGGRRRQGVAVWLQPVREIMSVIMIVASFMTSGIVWRGRSMLADKAGSLTQ